MLDAESCHSSVTISSGHRRQCYCNQRQHEQNGLTCNTRGTSAIFCKASVGSHVRVARPLTTLPHISYSLQHSCCLPERLALAQTYVAQSVVPSSQERSSIRAQRQEGIILVCQQLWFYSSLMLQGDRQASGNKAPFTVDSFHILPHLSQSSSAEASSERFWCKTRQD